MKCKIWLLLQGYIARALALHSQGFVGFVGIAKESSYGTPVGATDYFEIMSENLSESIDRFPTRNVFGGFYDPDDYAGARRAAGSLSMFGHPVSMGILLKAAMSTISGSPVLSGFLHLSRFISTKSDFSNTIACQPYTLEINRDVTSSHQFAGAVCNRLQLALAPNQDLRLTADWIAQAGLLLAQTTPTYPGSPTDPFTFETASLSIGGSATARWEAFSMNINNNLDGILALNASNNIIRVRRRGPQEVTIGGTIDFTDVAEFLDFKNQTERQLQLTLTRANSFSLLIDVPRFVYTSFPTGIAGRDRLTINVAGKARYSTTSAVAVSLGLTTTKSNY